MISAKKLMYKTIQKIASMKTTLSSHTSTLSSHTSQLNTVDSRISAKYIIDGYSASGISVTAGGVSDTTINVTKSGYIQLGIVQVSKSGVNSGHCVLSQFYIDSNHRAHIAFKNTGSAAATITIAIQVLFKKN
jgi:hypothetical protein